MYIVYIILKTKSYCDLLKVTVTKYIPLLYNNTIVPAQGDAARLKKGTAQLFRPANLARIFINLC